MDEAPYTGDLDLAAVITRDDLATLLRIVHMRADKPSLRGLEARTRHDATPLSKSAVAEMLKGVRFPRKAVMITFLRACGVQEGSLELWRRTWERVAAGEEAALGRPADGASVSTETVGMGQLREQIDQLKSDNNRLRTQLDATKQQVVQELSPKGVTSGQRVHSPVVSRRELGTMLRALRTGKGMTVERVADHLMCSQTKVRRIEHGFRSGTIRDVRDLCELYGVTEVAQRDHLMDLAREGKQQGWWQSYDLPYSTYVGLEAEAASIKNYHSTVVDGLLQIADYARALHSIVAGLKSEVIEQRVKERLMRQRRLTEADPPRVWSIMDEAALHQVVGGPAVMKAQLERLIEVAGLPNVTLQVIPSEVGAHRGMDSPFTILEFAAPVETVVYMEGLFGWIYLEHRRDVERCNEMFKILQAQAWSQKESMEKITQISQSLRNRS